MAVPTFNEDELDFVTVTKTPPAATAAAVAPAQPKPPAPVAAAAKPHVEEVFEEETPGKAKAEADNCDTDFDDEKVYVRPGQLDQCRPEKRGEAARFAFVPKEWIKFKSAKSHYLEFGTGKDAKKGRFRCLSPLGSEEPGWCCVRLKEDGTVDVVALVVRYTNANPVDGKYVAIVDPVTGAKSAPPIAWALQFIRLTQWNLKQIKKLPDEESSPFDIDIVMTKAEGKAFGYEFNRISPKARWLQNPELVAEIKAAAQKFIREDGKILKAKLGKKLSLVEWKAMLAGVATSAEDAASMGDVADL
jgi:hypothetical protein